MVTHRLSEIARIYGSFNRKKGLWRRVLLHPVDTFKLLQRVGSTEWINEIFESKKFYKTYMAELRNSGFLVDLESKLDEQFNRVSGRTVRGNPYVHGALKVSHAEFIYALIRHTRPQIIVETGVCNGFSSAVILFALNINGSGHLWSVDLPEIVGQDTFSFWEGKGGAIVPGEQKPGWLVPDQLSSRWTLRLGHSSEILPELFHELESVDLFLHDSEHSFKNQLFEFEAALTHVSSNGLVLASDTNCSNAFEHFVENHGSAIKYFWIDHSFAVVKPASHNR